MCISFISFIILPITFIGGWWGLNVALSLVNEIWVWNKNISDPLTYEDKWAAGQPSSDGNCVNFIGTGVGFGLNDHACANLKGYICEDIHCYLL